MSLPNLMLKHAILVTVFSAFSGCVGVNPLLAPSIAEPDTRPARNFTSFSAALDCMDRLLAGAGRRQTLISSSDIPDETKLINVGADDMLINAISQMNRRSQAYIFVDQALIKFGGLLDVEVQNGDEVTPQYYIRGSISQLDRDVTNDSASVDGSFPSGNLTGSKFGPYRKLSVVSVDMHLVAFPSRRVIAGASVANSMVVVGQGFGASATGLIDLATLGFSVQINRVESQSQAVRNLIEVGLIELLGRHSGVPYWTCLAQPVTSAKSNGRKERKFTRKQVGGQVKQAQEMLVQLGYLSNSNESGNGPKTRAAISAFQAHEKILPNGIVDFDLIVLLKRRLGMDQVVTVTKPKKNVVQSASTPPKTTPSRHKNIPTEARGIGCATSSPTKPCGDGYINLHDFLNKK